jgi:O-antigen/teichoic acid export membrane protein
MIGDTGVRTLSTMRRRLPAQIAESWALVVAMLGSHVLSYLFQLVMSRSLPASDFGLLNGLMAFALLITIPVSTIKLTVARQTAEMIVRGGYDQVRRFVRDDLRRTTLIILAGIAGYLVVAPYLSSFFHTSLPPIWLVGAFCLASLYVPFAEGVLQGMQRFNVLAAGILTRYVGKLALGALLVMVGLGVEGALAALFLATTAQATYWFAAVASTRGTESAKTGATEHEETAYPRDVWPTLVTYSSVVLLMNLDVTLARHYLSAADSAHYAIAALLGKIAYYLPGFVVIILVPRVASASASGRSTSRYLAAAFMATFAASASVVLVYALLQERVIAILFGSAYASPDTATLVLFYSVAMLILSLLYLEVHYLLARRYARPLYGLLAGPAVALLGMVLRHGSGLELVGALTLGLVSGLLMVNVLAIVMRGSRGDSRGVEREGHAA